MQRQNRNTIACAKQPAVAAFDI